jgi:transcriptional regulator with XRE-family HTH domain
MELKIREIMESKDIKVSSLAETVGITRANMSNIVNGKSTPSLDTLDRIATALNVDITELFKKNDSGEDVNGYIKVKGTVYEIHSFDDLEKVLKLKEE